MYRVPLCFLQLGHTYPEERVVSLNGVRVYQVAIRGEPLLLQHDLIGNGERFTTTRKKETDKKGVEA